VGEALAEHADGILLAIGWDRTWSVALDVKIIARTVATEFLSGNGM